MKFYMLYHTPSGGFYRTFFNNFDEVVFSGPTEGKRLNIPGISNLIRSIVGNENNGVSKEDLEIYEFTGKKVS